MEKCPKCGADMKLGMLQDWSCGSIEEADESITESRECLRRQLAAANERVGELERELAERGKDIIFFSELHDSAVAALDESPWRSMESAPRDGTWVLSIYAVAVFPMLSLDPVRWVEDSWYDQSDSQTTPTHWMPLPAAPEVKP